VINTLPIYKTLSEVLDEKTAQQITAAFEQYHALAEKEAVEKLATRRDIEELKLQIEQAKTATIKWTAGIMVAQFLAIAAFILQVVRY